MVRFTRLTDDQVTAVLRGLETREDIEAFVRVEAEELGFTPTRSQFRYRVRRLLQQKKALADLEDIEETKEQEESEEPGEPEEQELEQPPVRCTRGSSRGRSFIHRVKQLWRSDHGWTCDE